MQETGNFETGGRNQKVWELCEEIKPSQNSHITKYGLHKIKILNF